MQRVSKKRNFKLQNFKEVKKVEKCSVFSHSVVPNSADPVDFRPPGSPAHGDSPGKNTGVGRHGFFQGIFPTQGSNAGLLHCR